MATLPPMNDYLYSGETKNFGRHGLVKKGQVLVLTPDEELSLVYGPSKDLKKLTADQAAKARESFIESETKEAEEAAKAAAAAPAPAKNKK